MIIIMKIYWINLLFQRNHYHYLKTKTVKESAIESTGKATAPEFQLPACCSFPVVWLWSGSWLTPTRGNPDGYVTERSRLWKEEKVVSRARSIN